MAGSRSLTARLRRLPNSFARTMRSTRRSSASWASRRSDPKTRRGFMRHEEASRTTQRPALLRAAHQILDAEPKIHHDPLAVGLTPEASVESIRANERLIRGSDCMLLRSAFVLRARYAEDCLAAAALAGVSQYVILGAGMDTFAYRQPEHARAMRIFEVDHPSTQAAKRGCFAKRGLRTPANLAFVALDFEH